MKYILVIGDGMADDPLPELGGRTPLEACRKPYFDSLCERGELGLVQTIPEGFPPGSDTAIMGIFGCDPAKYFSGRAPLELAAGGGVMPEGGACYRCNMVTLGGEGLPFAERTMLSHSAGSIEGEERVISASNEAELGTFLVNALSLEKHLYMDEPNIFYLTDDIVASRTEYSKGEIIESYDESGKVRGLLEVTDSMDGINIYSPIYENDLRAGLSLRKGPTFSLSARAFSPLSRIAFGFAVDLAYLPLFPYFNLLASFLVNYDGIVSYHGGLGAEVRLPLKSIINTRFTLIEDGSISASAIFYMGYDGSFAVDSEFMVFYEHHATSRFFWRLGYEGGTISVGSLMLSCGVLL